MEHVKTNVVATDNKRWSVLLVYVLQYIDAKSFFVTIGRKSRIIEMGRQVKHRLVGGTWSMERRE